MECRSSATISCFQFSTPFQLSIHAQCTSKKYQLIGLQAPSPNEVLGSEQPSSIPPLGHGSALAGPSTAMHDAALSGALRHPILGARSLAEVLDYLNC